MEKKKEDFPGKNQDKKITPPNPQKKRKIDDFGNEPEQSDMNNPDYKNYDPDLRRDPTDPKNDSQTCV